MKTRFTFTLLLSCVLFAVACSNPSGGSSASSAKEITGFSFETPPASGMINLETIFVLVPSGTDLTDLVPTITVSPGASVSPESGEEQDFTTSVSYTVTAEDSSTKVWTVTVQSSLEGVSAAVSYLASASGGLSADDPVFLPVGIDLADTSGDGWADLLAAIETAEKYVSLDLSASIMSGTEFDAKSTEAASGEKYISSLTLPDSAESVKAGTGSNANAAFSRYTALTSVSGAHVETIGAYAFYASNTTGPLLLVTADFPAATAIGDYAFRGCASLAAVEFPAVTAIGSNAFGNCKALVTAAFPAVTGTIGNSAFTGCTSLVTADFQAATEIGSGAFSACSALETADFPEVKVIGANAFFNCSALVTTDFSKATDIGGSAFRGCRLMVTAEFPKATAIGNNAFQSCGSLVTTDFSVAETIGNSAFMSCGGLVVAEFPLATSIGTSAFYSCFELVTANFPVVETIGATAFQNCTALRTLNIPAATAIDNNAFQDTDQGINKEDAEATELTVTLGTVTPPTLGATLFFATPGAKSIAKSVIVKVPVAGTAGYGSSPTDTTTDNWGNAFRGKGWNGTNYLTGTVNEKIMLTIETY